MQYDEYTERNKFAASESLQQWISGRIVSNFIKFAGIQPSETKILEIGSGLGRIAKECINLNFEKYAAIEPTSTLADATRGLSSEIVVYENYLPNTPTSIRGKFDAVISFHVLEHAPDQYAAREWVKSMTETLSDDGVILISGPDIRDYGTVFWDSDWSHGYPLTPRRVKQIFDDLGIQTLKCTSLHFGSASLWARTFAQILRFVIPFRLLDSFFNRMIGRPIASGAGIALIYGVTFVVGKVGKTQNLNL